MIIAMAEARLGAEIAYRLCKDPIEAARIAVLPTVLVGREINQRNVSG